MDIIWKEAGISMHFPATLGERDIKISVQIFTNREQKCILPQQYQNMPMVSPVYEITASAKLPAPVRVKVEHCAVVDKEDSLIYMVAHNGPPNIFEPLDGGYFPLNKSHGEIELMQFSLLTILYNIFDWKLTLAIHIAYLKDNIVHFLVTKNLPANCTAVQEIYRTRVSKLQSYIMQYFYKTTKISLSIPELEPGCDGWCIEPSCKPVTVGMLGVHTYQPGGVIPKIELKLKWQGNGKPEEQEIDIGIEGGSMESFSLSCKSAQQSPESLPQSQQSLNQPLQPASIEDQLPQPTSWSLHKADIKKLTPDPPKYSVQRVDKNNQIKVSEAPLLTDQYFVYTGKHMEFIWEEAGISLHFPAASCERDIRVSVKILTDIKGNCILPKGYRLMPAASATYKITASAHFPAPVRLRMEHCAVIEKENSLVFMVAPCSTPYNFTAVGKGKFNESHGEIEIKHFSVWKIFYNIPYLSKSLAIQVVYLSNRCTLIVVTKKTALYCTSIREEYPNAKNIDEHLIRCFSHTLEIAFSVESENNDDGWNIKFDPTPASINMTDISEYEPGDTVPYVKVTLEWKGNRDQQEKDIQIKVQGGDIESFSLHCKPDQVDHSLEQQTTAQSTPGSWATPYIPPESTSLSAESRALRRSNVVFNSGVDPDYLITYLYSKFLLTPSEKLRVMEVATSEKPEKIFTTMERRVSVSPGDFHTLLQALKDEPAMRGLWKQMQGDL